eukprot:TRINITY_DN14566_c0_g1_i1.p1 TRINITY_DN14566_c0_g1~~TRINITY_DN14566_c0_g1_i1.p1  ORF type:complete len:223 (-),score=28.57 TRINITY_DN14566_c0_g1_i1:558-1196(-)
MLKLSCSVWAACVAFSSGSQMTTGRSDVDDLCRYRWPSAPVPCRNDFAFVANQHFKKTGNAVEVGVQWGNFARRNLFRWNGTYYMIDTWGKLRLKDDNSDGTNSAADNIRNMRLARNMTWFARKRRFLVRADSLAASQRFGDATFDWIYIDANHSHAAVLADLQAWYPKLRPGGLMSGDDYGDVERTPMVTVDRWEAQYGKSWLIQDHSGEL